MKARQWMTAGLVLILLLTTLLPWAGADSPSDISGGVGGTRGLDLPLSIGVTTRVSVASDGTAGTSHSYDASISADGRFVAFSSEAENLVSGDYNNWSDVFVHDRETGHTERVSVASDGTEGASGSHDPSISADGRFVAFTSISNNLVSGDTNDRDDVFVHDRVTGHTERVSVASDGSQGDSSAHEPSISADGRHVAFTSRSSNLVYGDTGLYIDVFVHDRQTGQTERVSVASDGAQGNGEAGHPSISADGRYVAFDSDAPDLIDGDTNWQADVFVHDRQTGQTERVSLTSDGNEANGVSTETSISADGRYVAFRSTATNLVSGDTTQIFHDIFVRDRATGHTERVSVASDGAQGNGESSDPAVSADGRYVAFYSDADNLVSGDTNGKRDVFVHDRQSGQTERSSVSSSGIQGNDRSFDGSISVNGRYLAFLSDASNLICDDTSPWTDVFVRDRESVQVDAISGRVNQANGMPVSDVTISAGSGITTTTTAVGDYTLAVTACHTYTVTPSLEDYVFSPPQRKVTVPPEGTGQDFVMLSPPVSTTLTAGAGTTLTYTDTQGLPTRVEFPAGAVSETMTLVMTPTVASDHGQMVFAGHALELEAYQGGVKQPGFVFSSPVTITIAYSAADVRVVSEESELILEWWTGAGWAEAAGTCDPPSTYDRDLGGRTLSLSMCHLSTFGLFGPTRPVYLPLIARGS